MKRWRAQILAHQSFQFIAPQFTDRLALSRWATTSGWVNRCQPMILLPEDVAYDGLWSLESGGLIAPRCSAETACDHMVELASESSLLVVEESVGHASDPGIKRNDLPRLVVDDDVYWYAVVNRRQCDQVTLRTIRRVYGRGASSKGFLFDVDEGVISLARTNGPAALTQLTSEVSRLRLVIMEAHDGETYVLLKSGGTIA